MTEKEQNERMDKEFKKAASHQESFEFAVIEELKTSLKWKLSVLLLLIFFCAMKVADLVWDYDRNNDLKVIARMVASNASAIAENQKVMNRLNTDRDESIRATQAAADAVAALKGMSSKNFTAIQTVDEHLRQCSGCHSHPRIKPPMSNRPIN